MSPNESERMRILEMIDSGVISPSEGLALLSALDGVEPALPEGDAEILDGELEPAETSFEAQAEMPLPPAGETRDLEAVETQDFATSETRDFASTEAQDLDTAETIHGSGAHPAFASETASAEGAGQEASRGEVLSPPVIGPDFSHWRKFWQIPLWVGVGITIVAGVLMYLAWQGSGFGFWFACTWLPFLFGVAVMALAWSTRNLPWLHLRVYQKEGHKPQRIAISLPLPLGLISWALRTFKHRIPDTGNVNIDEMVMALKHVSPDAPLSVDVNEGANGEHVQIYIG